ncbi:hypothetical protein HQQ81_08045 [Microbacteriaceae bacterium VKM Ac-2854]|nr:hypothetical protein [Microbacteriaceae bacterium VKM Ac-2854]
MPSRDGHTIYRDLRPVVLPNALDDLRAELPEVVTLPNRLAWSGPAQFVTTEDGSLRELYSTVIREASTAEDLAAYLDETTLIRLWPTLMVGRDLEQAWAQRFPELPAVA